MIHSLTRSNRFIADWVGISHFNSVCVLFYWIIFVPRKIDNRELNWRLPQSRVCACLPTGVLLAQCCFVVFFTFFGRLEQRNNEIKSENSHRASNWGRIQKPNGFFLSRFLFSTRSKSNATEFSLEIEIPICQWNGFHFNLLDLCFLIDSMCFYLSAWNMFFFLFNFIHSLD